MAALSPVRLASVLLLYVAATGSAPAQTLSAPGAQVVTLRGTLTARATGQATRPLRLNDAVQTGDELITGENSEAVIRTSDGATVCIFPDSRVILSERPSGLREFLQLLLGSVKVHIERLSGRPNPHSLTTPTAVIAVRGTTFTVLVDDTESTLVAVDEGMVSVANISSPAQEVMLQRGQRTWVRPGLPPMQARRFQGSSEHIEMAAPSRMGEGQMGGSRMGQNGGMWRGMGDMQGRAGPPH